MNLGRNRTLMPLIGRGPAEIRTWDGLSRMSRCSARLTLHPVDPLEDLRQKIDAHGWAIRNVSDADPEKALSYTVGLTVHDHPEVVMTGLPPEVGSAFLNIVGEVVVREGGRFTAGQATTELSDGPAMPVIVVADKTELTAVSSFYGDVPALQIVWTDSGGRLPWEPGYANPPGSQRLLGAI